MYLLKFYSSIMRHYYDVADCAAIRCLFLNVHDQLYGWWPGRAAMSCAAISCARVAWRWRRPWMASWYFQIKRSPGHAGRRGASSGARAVAWLFWKSGGGAAAAAWRVAGASAASRLHYEPLPVNVDLEPRLFSLSGRILAEAGLALLAAICVVRQVAWPVNVLAGQQPGGMTLYFACFHGRIDSKNVIRMWCLSIFLAQSFSLALSRARVLV